MYIIYRNIWSKNQALYNIKKSIDNKNSNHCVNNDFTNTFLTAQMRSLDSRRQSRVLNQVITNPALILKRKQVKNNKNLVFLNS